MLTGAEKLLVGILGASAAYLALRGRGGVRLDSDLGDRRSGIVRTALARETDPSVLHALAAKLGAAGHHDAAAAVMSRAEMLRGGGA